MTIQEYVLELHRKALDISPCLHDALGCYISFDRSGDAIPLPSLLMSLQVQLTALRVPSSPDSSLASSRLPFSPVPSFSYQSGTSALSLVSALHTSRAVSWSAMHLAHSWPQVF